jgi:outer membrane protein assembly factor BamB
VAPSPEFAQALLDRLLDEFAREEGGEGASGASSAGATTEPHPIGKPGPRRPWRHRSPRAWWPYLEFVAAMLLIVALSGVGLSLGPGLPDLGGGDRDEQTDWPTFRGDAARTGATSSTGPVEAPAQLWSLRLGRRLNNPVVADDTLYVSGGGTLFALATEDGSERWHVDLGATPSDDTYSVPAIAGDRIYIGTVSGDLLALDTATGQERWRVTTGGEIEGSPAIVDSVLYVGSADGNVYALDAATGAERWRQVTGPVRVSPAVVAGTVYVVSVDGVAHALDAATGTPLWTTQVVGDHVALAVADGVIVLADLDGLIRAIDAATGRERWQYSASGEPRAPAVVDGTVYVPVRLANGAPKPLIALDVATGTELWLSAVRADFGSPTAAGDLLFVGTRERAVYALDRATGAERYRVTTGPVTTSVTVAGGVLYVACVDGTIFAFGGSDSETGGGSG